MKKLFLFFIGLCFSFISLSQSCLQSGITFNKQAQIDYFHINYPNCTQIEGSVTIMDDDITNLTGLNVLTSIGGYLNIKNTDSLQSLSGLDNITSIGGDITFLSNRALFNLTGLEGLTSISGSLLILNNLGFVNLIGLNNVTSINGSLSISFNPSLTNLIGLNNLTFIGEGLNIGSYNGLTSLSGLEGLKSIGGELGINSNNALTNLGGLEGIKSIGGDLWIQSNENLTSLSALEALDSINGNIWITNNQSLTTLTGLDNIDSGTITGLHIYQNPNLSYCTIRSVCNYLASQYGDINNNASGCNSQAEIDTACKHLSVENLTFNTIFSLFPNPAINEITIETSGEPKESSLAIVNSAGQELIKRQLIEHKTVIDITNLPSGVYF